MHGFYVNFLGQRLRRFPLQSLPLHRFLKAEFPPEPNDYESLFNLGLRMDQEAFRTFEKIYKDHPVSDIYPVIVPGLYKRGIRTEATRWHYILLKRNDLPKSFYECKPLLEHYTHVKQKKEAEKLPMSLGQSPSLRNQILLDRLGG